MSGPNRRARRAAEKIRRAQTGNAIEAKQERAGAAQAEVQRLSTMLQCAQQAMQLAGAIPTVEEPEGGFDPESGDPNAFKLAVIEEFMERQTTTRESLILAHEEFFLAVEALDPKAPNVIEAPPPVQLAATAGENVKLN